MGPDNSLTPKTNTKECSQTISMFCETPGGTKKGEHGIKYVSTWLILTQDFNVISKVSNWNIFCGHVQWDISRVINKISNRVIFAINLCRTNKEFEATRYKDRNRQKKTCFKVLNLIIL